MDIRLSILPINYTQSTLSWEADSCSASQEISRLLGTLSSMSWWQKPANKTYPKPAESI
jgi:hypothetical protein